MYASAKSRGIILMVDRDFSFCCASDNVDFVVFLVVVDLLVPIVYSPIFLRRNFIDGDVFVFVLHGDGLSCPLAPDV